MDSTEWVTIREAAERLGVSTKTVRRRLKAGKLVGQQTGDEPTSPWRIQITGTDTPPPPVSGPELTATLVHLETVLEHLDAMTGKWQEAAEAAAIAEAKLETQRERLDETRGDLEQERLRAVELEAERDRAQAEAEYLRTRRWWQSKIPPPDRRPKTD